MPLHEVHPELKALPDLIFAQHDSTIGKDLRQNLTDLLEYGALTPEEAGLALLALATAVNQDALAHYAREKLAAFKLPQEQMQEAAETAALTTMLNVYYTFQRIIRNEEDYRGPRLRMRILIAPKLGKTRFEMLAFAISVLNACESCVIAHEERLRKDGVNVDKIHDLVRLAAVVKGLKILEAA